MYQYLALVIDSVITSDMISTTLHTLDMQALQSLHGSY